MIEREGHISVCPGTIATWDTPQTPTSQAPALFSSMSTPSPSPPTGCILDPTQVAHVQKSYELHYLASAWAST
jgi:hypothetical protein